MPIGETHHRNEPIKIQEPIAVTGTISATEVQLSAANTLVGNFVVSPTTTEVKVGATKLAGRKELLIFNDSSSLVSLSFETPIVLANNSHLTLLSGEELSIALDPIVNSSVYARTEEVTTQIRIMEVN